MRFPINFFKDLQIYVFLFFVHEEVNLAIISADLLVKNNKLWIITLIFIILNLTKTTINSY